MRKLMIAAPWIGPAYAAFYVSQRWAQLPTRIAVAFFRGKPARWSAKTAATPFLFALTAFIMALLTTLLLSPNKIRMAEPAATTLAGMTGSLTDEPIEKRLRERILFAAQFAIGVWPPFSSMHIMGWNLR